MFMQDLVTVLGAGFRDGADWSYFRCCEHFSQGKQVQYCSENALEELGSVRAGSPKVLFLTSVTLAYQPGSGDKGWPRAQHVP